MEVKSISSNSRPTFCRWIESTYHKPVKVVLKSFEKRGFVYDDVVLISSYSVNTVRKWCRKYDVHLNHNKNNQSAEIRKVMIARVANAQLSMCNILSKAWQ